MTDDALALTAHDAPAIVLGDRTITFAELAHMVAHAPGAHARAIVATPELSTLVAIYRALADRAPLALIHPRLTASEQQRQMAVVANAGELPAGTAFVLFTSGSTAAARGVVLSRAAVLANATASAAHLGWRDDDRWLLALSLAHAGGLSIATRCLVARKPIVAFAEPSDARATLASLVPTQLAALLDDPAWAPPPRLRAVLLGGAAAPPSLLAAARARGVPIRATYGLTETFGQVATARDAHAAPTPLPGVTLIADRGTRDAPACIAIRGPMLATCYLDGAPIAPELATADLGYLDDAGALHVAGRADDVIITGGENVHPAAIEAVLAATPGVRAALAFGIPDVRWGQRVAAAIAVDQPARFDLAAACARWRVALPPHARPRHVALVAELPVGATGKLDRRAASVLALQPLVYR